jgi:uncharacterized membrane protein YfcA
VAGALGSVPGALLALSLPGETLRILFASFLALTGLAMLFRRGGGDAEAPDEDLPRTDE